MNILKYLIIPTLLLYSNKHLAQGYKIVDEILPNNINLEVKYDSLYNISTNKDIEYFRQFIGQSIIFLPRGKMSKDAPIYYPNFEINNPITVRIDTINEENSKRNKKYILQEIKSNRYKAIYVQNAWLALCGLSSVQYRSGNEEIFPYHWETEMKSHRTYTGYYTRYSDIEGKYFTIHNIKKEGDTLANLIFTLSDEKGDTLNWIANGHLSGMRVVYPIVIKGFLDKINKEYIGRDFYIVGTKHTSNKTDSLIGKKLHFKEVVFYNKKDSYCIPAIICNNSSATIAISLCEVPSIFSYTIDPQDYLSRKEDIFFNDLVLVEAKEYEKILLEKELNEIKRKELIIKKYGNTNGQKILEHKLWIGMTKQMLIDSWGYPPNGVNRTVGSFGTHEQWCYDGTYIYIENGIVTAYQD